MKKLVLVCLYAGSAFAGFFDPATLPPILKKAGEQFNCKSACADRGGWSGSFDDSYGARYCICNDKTRVIR